MNIISKRITLFPADAKSLTEESLMDYIRPFGELKYMPSVGRGISLIQSHDNITPKEVFTVDLSNKENGITISVAAERIDIISSSQDDLCRFLIQADAIIGILDSIHTSGYYRIAAGAEFSESYSKEQIQEMMKGTTKIPFNQEVVEWSERSASRKSFVPDNSDIEMLYNDVTTIYINILKNDRYQFKSEYDINTYIPQNNENISEYRDRVSKYKREFLKMAINLINDHINPAND